MARPGHAVLRAAGSRCRDRRPARPAPATPRRCRRRAPATRDSRRGRATVADSATRRSAGRDLLQPRHAQAEQVAALAGREGVDLVDDDRPQPGEHREAVGIAQQQRQRFGRGQQDLRRADPLARLAVAGGVAGAGLDADVEAHFLDRRDQVARDVDRQRLQRRHVERVQALGRRLDQFGQRRQEAGQRLARAGRRDQQGVIACAALRQHLQLMPPRSPPARREPVGQRLGERGLSTAVMLNLFQHPPRRPRRPCPRHGGP